MNPAMTPEKTMVRLNHRRCAHSLCWNRPIPVSYKVRIDVRDYRYRVTFSDVRLYLDGPPRALDYTDRDSTERRAREHFEQLGNSLDQYLTRPKDDF